MESQEAIWARAACHGDAVAFERIVMRFQRPVYGLCSRYLRGPDAEDAAQETFVRAFLHMSDFDPDRPLLPWLVTIARRLCLDRLRKNRPEADSEAVEASFDPEQVSAEQTAATREQMSQLQNALQTLPPEQREALVLFHLEGMAYQEIAKALDAPVGTVMTWLHRGRAQLKTVMQQSGMHLAGKASGVAP
jgi:RNA polymerase sigma-70 factor, ECF subfamily